MNDVIEHAGQTAFDYRLHDGEGEARFQWYFLDASRMPVAVQRWELAPGASEGMHAHGSDRPLEELYLVTDGMATMRVDDRTYHLGPGDAVLAPVGAEHDLRNTGNETLRLVVVFGAPGTTDWSWSGMARAARTARTGAADRPGGDAEGGAG